MGRRGKNDFRKLTFQSNRMNGLAEYGTHSACEAQYEVAKFDR